MRTYCIDRSQGEGEVEVVAVVDISVLHKPQIFISHHLRRAQDGHLSRRFLTATVKKKRDASTVFSLPDRCLQASSLQKAPSSLPYGPGG